MDTVADLFDLAIAAENAAAELYRQLAVKFAHAPEAAGFWQAYAADEIGHARALEHLRAGLTAEQLAAPADAECLRNARKSAEFSVERALSQVHNLEDAYQLAHALEHSETNAVFDFLITRAGLVRQAHPFLRSQLTDHIGKIEHGFPSRYAGRSARLGVKAA